MSVVSLEDAIIYAITENLDPGEVEDAKDFYEGTTLNELIDAAFSE